MSSFDASLDLAVFKNVGVDDIQEAFVFIVDSQKYSCPRIIARLLSRRLLLQHSIDASISEYAVETKDLQNEFQIFMSLVGDGTIRLTPMNRPFLFSLSRELDNSDIFSSFLRCFHGDLSAQDLCTVLDRDDALAFLASEFYKFDNTELDQIPLSTLYHILSHPWLKISREDSLYSYLRLRLSSDPETLTLFQFVHFEYLSPNSLSDFQDINPECIDRRLWSRLSRRLRAPLPSSAARPGPRVDPPRVDSPRVDSPRVDPPRVGPYRAPRPISKPFFLWNQRSPAAPHSRLPREGKFLLNSAFPFAGMINYLTRQHGGNVHDTGTVAVTSKSVYAHPDFAIRNIADLPGESWFRSRNEPGQWICWDFLRMRLRPTHYTARAVYPFMRSWVIESSLDGQNWTEIDRKTDTDDLKNNHNRVAAFEVSKVAECRFIRLTQTGKNSSGDDQLAILGFEFFGYLRE
jgi:hypothetical protein